MIFSFKQMLHAFCLASKFENLLSRTRAGNHYLLQHPNPGHQGYYIVLYRDHGKSTILKGFRVFLQKEVSEFAVNIGTDKEDAISNGHFK